MDEMLERVREVIYKAVEGATIVAKGAIDKTNNVAGRTKLSFAVSETESKIKDCYKELGKLVYENYKANGSDDEELLERFSQIDKLYDEVKILKDKIAQLKETKVCSECGEHNRPENNFCAKCGAKLEDISGDDIIDDIKSDFENAAEDIKDKAEETADSIKDTAEEIVDKVIDDDTKEKIKDTIDNAEDAIESFADRIKEKAADLKDAASKRVVTIKARKPSDKE